jgi:hypothetical protein
MRRIFFILLFLLSATPLFAEPRALVSEEAIDLGSLEEGRIYEHEFFIQNVGDEDLSIDVAMPSCGCVQILEPTTTQRISSQEKLGIKFSFDSTGMWGWNDKYIFIRTNDPDSPVIKVMVSANVEKQDTLIINRFKSFGIGAITTAGLIDGVNPCAFTVLVFFISFLTFVGYHRRQIFILGIFFILAVFLTYLGIGLGLFEFFRSLEIIILLSRIIYYITAVLALTLGVFSLYDWWIFNKTKDPDKVKIKLPGIIKKQIQGVIRHKTDDRTRGRKDRSILALIFTALSCGFIVSLLESVCTGQLYLPTIVFVLGVPELKAKAFLYLLLYNLMFILPLLIVFGFAFLGVNSERFAKIAHMHLAKVKLLTAIVFFALGFSLLFIIRK